MHIHTTPRIPDGRELRVAVIGAGLAGLAAACFAARGGARVTLLEAHSKLGGRARTRFESGHGFNYGPHALYRAGLAEEVLGELDIELAARAPDLGRALAHHAGRLHTLPQGPVSLVTTGLLRAHEKLAFAQLLARLPHMDPAPWARRPLAELLEELLPTPTARELLAALTRLTTYTHASHTTSAGFALEQLALALRGGVRYVEGGWQQLVQRLADAARRAGVRIETRARLRHVSFGDEIRASVGSSSLADDTLRCDRLILALGPEDVARVLSGSTSRPDPRPAPSAELLDVLSPALERLQPVRAACLDVGLSSLPDARRTFALGIDRPTYASLHSHVAGLAPTPGATFQLARYLAPGESVSRQEIQSELESLLEDLQPGWRSRCTLQRVTTGLVVSHDLPSAQRGGLAGRVAVDALAETGHPVYLAGDWIGREGWLADASLASGRRAGHLCLRPMHRREQDDRRVDAGAATRSAHG